MTAAVIVPAEKSALSKLRSGTGVLAVVGILLTALLVPPILTNDFPRLFLQRIFDGLNFAQANMAMFGTYVAWWFAGQNQGGLGRIWLAIGAAMVLSAAFGAVVERALIRPFDPTDNLPVVLITFGIAAVLEAAAGGLFGLEPHAFKSPFPASPEDRFVIAGANLRFETLGTLAVLALMAFAIFAVLGRTKVGLAFRAVSSNGESARLVGVRTGRTLQFGWAFAVALGTLGGTLVANDTQLDPAFMAKLTIFAFAAATLGGLDSIGGAIIGAFIVATVQSLLVGYAREVPGIGWLASNFALVIAFVVILIVLLFKPSGLFGTRRVERV